MMRTALGVILCLLFAVAVAAADEPPSEKAPPEPEPPTPEQAAAKVLEAFRAKDAAALEVVAEADKPDPWIVVDELLRRGAPEAAAAFARAAPRPRVEKLPDYVAARGDREPDPKTRDELARVAGAIQRRAWPEAARGAREAAALPDTVSGARIAFLRGQALGQLRRLPESAAAYHRAAQIAERIGWLPMHAAGYERVGRILYGASQWHAARKALVSALVPEQKLGNQGVLATTLNNIGLLSEKLGEIDVAMRYYGRALPVFEALKDSRGIGMVLGNMGNAWYARGAYRKAIEHHERALALRIETGDHAEAAKALTNLGHAHRDLGEFDRALDDYGRALAMREGLGDVAGVGTTLNNIGGVLRKRGEYLRAIEYHARARKILGELGDRAGVASTLLELGNVRTERGDYLKALDLYRQALAASESLRDPRGTSQALNNAGVVHEFLGDYEASLAAYERARALKAAIGDRAGVASSLANMGNSHLYLGNHARALALHTEALELREALQDRRGIAVSQASIALVQLAIGDFRPATASLEGALASFESLRDDAGRATTLLALASSHERAGHHERALGCYRRADEALQRIGNRAGLAESLLGQGNLEQRRGRYAAALELFERSRRAYADLGSRARAAAALGSMAASYRLQGDLPHAVETYDQALSELDAGAPHDCLALVRIGLAETHLDRHAFGVALEHAKKAVEPVLAMTARLGDDEGALARDQWMRAFEVGAEAAFHAGATEDLFFFLEGGRALGLREALQVRKSLAASLVPRPLRAEEAAARTRAAAALIAYERLREGHDAHAVADARAKLRDAWAAVVAVVQRIQREAKAEADISHPRPAPLEVVRAWLRPKEALLVIGPARDQTLAVLVTSKGATAHALGPETAIEEQVRRMDLSHPQKDSAAPIAALRVLVTKPLALDKNITHVLVSASGPLAYVPFALLMPDLEVSYVPSATTYGQLRSSAPERGEMVLALGDPDYEAPLDGPGGSPWHGGRTLPRLAETRKEVEAIGNRLLLGRQATEAALARALSERDRWRAVHLACHGLVDRERPIFSSLAIAPDAEHDGRLTSLEIFRMKIPADLVVLSACETGTGKLYRSEGIVGLTRAFMFAGAPRVVCSLWDVDDEATRALMIRFYELWNPKDGEKGLPAAAALKRAQAYVRDHPDHDWKHPYFWAAWGLWGLPD